MFRLELKKFLFNKKNIILLTILSLLLIASSLYMILGAPRDNQKGMLSKEKQAVYLALHPANGTIDSAHKKVFEAEFTALNENDIQKYFDIKYKDEKATVTVLLQTTGVSETDIKPLQDDVNYMNLVKKRGLDFELQAGSQVHAFGNFVGITLNTMVTGLFFLAYAILVSTSFSSDFENKENRYYYFAGISARKNLILKILSGLLVTSAWLVLVSIVDIIVIGFLNGFGSFNYPAYLINNIGQQTLGYLPVDNMAISVGAVIVISLFYLFLVLVFLSSLGALLSIIFKKSLVVVGFVAILTLGYQLIANLAFMQSIRRFIPMSYLNPIELLCHPNYLWGQSSLGVGIVYLSIVSLIFAIGATILLKNNKLRRI